MLLEISWLILHIKMVFKSSVFGGITDQILRMRLVMKLVAILICLLLCTAAAAYANKNDGIGIGIGIGMSLPCMMAYEEGGVSGVLNSPECPWLLPSSSSSLHSSNSNNHCPFATLQGRRDYQEDRLLCNLHLHLPFPHGYYYSNSFLIGVLSCMYWNQLKLAWSIAGEGLPSIGVAAIFDGHGGREASEMASAMLSPYLLINVAFMASKRLLPSNDEHNNTQVRFIWKKIFNISSLTM